MASFAKDINAEEIYKELGKPDGNKEKFFDSMKDVYMISLLLGFKYNLNPPIEKKSSDPIKEEIFGHDNKRIMDFMALYSTKDINVLKRTKESEELIHNMVESYANGGIYKLNELLNGDSSNLDNLIAVVKEFEEESIEIKKVDIADLLFEVCENTDEKDEN